MKNILGKYYHTVLCYDYKFSIWILFSCTTLFVQAQDIATLKKSLTLVKIDSIRSKLLFELGMSFERTAPDSSFFYIDQSLKLSQRTNNAKGIVRAMYGMGYINMYYTKDESIRVI
jgi:hypothetical protein